MSLNVAAKYFIRNDVQNILNKISGFDFNKIYSHKYNENLKKAEIQLLTNKELNLERKNSMNKAKFLLQTPPFLPSRNVSKEIISSDLNLNPLNLINSNYLFIDISLEVPKNTRMIVVREKGGVLRNATYDEREKMLNVYFPVHGTLNNSSQLFKPTNLEKSLQKKNYQIILNKACIEFEPNDPEFIRVSHRVYEYVNELRDFEILYSTRYFAALVFYLIWYKKIENLMIFFLQKSKISECLDLFELYSIVHNKNFHATTHLSEKLTDKDKLKVFIKNELKNSTEIERILQNDVENS